jgi:hypothetical protein
LRKTSNSLSKHELLRSTYNRGQAQPVLAAPHRAGTLAAKTGGGLTVPIEKHRDQSEILEKQMADVCGQWWCSDANKLGRRSRVMAHVC